VRVVCVIFCAVLSAAAQTADIRPSFDAAVVKPSSAPDGGQDFDTTTGYLVIKNMNLKSLVGRAYSVREDQVSGGPKWVEEDRFNVEGRAAGPAKGDALLLMLQSLLAERFQLDLHREQKPIPVYALVQDKGGMKVQADTAGGGSGWNGTRGKIVAQRVSLERLATGLARLLRTPVVDMTGAKGVYSFTLEYAPESTGLAESC